MPTTREPIDVLSLLEHCRSQVSGVATASSKSIIYTLYLYTLLPIQLRRSRDRFLESSQQIEALVERFSRETPMSDAPLNAMGSGKVPLAYGKPGELKVWIMLYL